MENIYKKYNEKINLFIFSFALIVITYLYGLVNFGLPIDSEMVINKDFMLPLGRWGNTLIRYYIFGGFVPYFTLLLGIFFISISSVFIVDLFQLDKLKSYIFIALFVTFPQLAYQLVFITQSDVIGLGILLSTLSTYIYLKNEKKLLVYPIIILLTVLYFAIYQTLLFVALNIYFIYLFIRISNHSEDFSFKKELKKIIIYLGLILIAAIIYFLSLKLIGFDSAGGYINNSYMAQSEKGRINNFITHFINNIIGKEYYGNTTSVFATISFIGLIILALFSKKKVLLKTLLLVTILLIPFFISLLISGDYHPPRLYIAAGISFAFFISYFGFKDKKIVGSFVVIIVFGIVLTNIFFITKLFYSDYRMDQVDQNIARDIAFTIKSKYPETDSINANVYFYGYRSYDKFKYKIDNSEVFGGSIFNWDNGSNYRIISFFKYYDLGNFELIKNQELDEIKDSIKTLPVWPDQNSIKKINNIIVIKLGNEEGSKLPE